jgi:F0F1-type ATP synthase assembly protein I
MVAEYTTLAFVLPVSAVVGYILGYLLDKEFGTSWIQIAGLILGIVAGFVQLIRQLRRDTRDDAEL